MTKHTHQTGYITLNPLAAGLKFQLGSTNMKTLSVGRRVDVDTAGRFGSTEVRPVAVVAPWNTAQGAVAP